MAYHYENGSANHVRLKKITHPDTGKVVDLLYGTGGGQDDQLSRLKQVKWNSPSGNKLFAQDWTFDPTGNWTAYKVEYPND